MMGMQDRDFKGIWIPKEIWLNEELSVLEKVLFAEIDSLDGDDGCYASNEYFMEFFNVSESTITRGISKLKSLGYIESSQIGGRSRVLRVVILTTQGSQNDYSGSSKNCVSSIIKKKENNIDNKSTLPGALSKNHSQVYKQRISLTDDLESGKDIDKQEKEKKKSPKDKFKDNCLAMIDDTPYDNETKSLLIEYFSFASDAKQAEDSDARKKIVNSSKLWEQKLNALAQLVKQGNSAKDVVRQSLEKRKYAFWEYREQSRPKSYSDHSDGIIVQTLSQEEAREVLKGYAERNGVV